MKKIRKRIPHFCDMWNSKLCMIMKNTMFILLLAVSQVIAVESYSQTTALSLNLKNTSIKQVLNQIEDESEFYFLYSSKIIDVERKVDVNVNGEKISTVLDKLFEGTNVVTTVMDRQIVLAPRTMPGTTSQQVKTVSGTVKDNNGQPIPGATILVKGTTVGDRYHYRWEIHPKDT